MALDFSAHPCFNGEIKHRFARIHLPVAPKCNVQCNFCNRKYDCVNESRPGVTSNVLAPKQALSYLKSMMGKVPNIKVMGIAGPGDPFANPEETMETLRLVRAEYPDMLLCVASNGLEVSEHVEEMAALQVSHVTITCCGIDPEIVKEIYAWVRYKKRVFRGVDAAQLMINKQLEAIRLCKQHGIVVKVNMIIVPGVNDHHIRDLAQAMSAQGVDLLNCMALCHVPDTPFETIVPPSSEEMNAHRAIAGEFLPQMRHCMRCRADAVGLLGKDLTDLAQSEMAAAAHAPLDGSDNRPYVAVASHEGLLVNQHLGEAKSVWVYGPKDNTYELIEQRRTPTPGNGCDRWVKLGEVLHDCRALLVGEAGQSPRDILTKSGIKVYRTEGMIEHALETIYQNGNIRTLSGPTRCGSGCSGNGMGCM